MQCSAVQACMHDASRAPEAMRVIRGGGLFMQLYAWSGVSFPMRQARLRAAVRCACSVMHGKDCRFF
jgi:hypothetical protein